MADISLVIGIVSLALAIISVVISIVVYLVAEEIRHENEQRDKVALKIIVEKMENFLFRVEQIQNTSSPSQIEIELLHLSHNTLRENLRYYSSSLKAEHITQVNLVMGRLSMLDALFDETSLYNHFKDKEKTDNQLQPMRDFVKKYKTEN